MANIIPIRPGNMDMNSCGESNSGCGKVADDTSGDGIAKDVACVDFGISRVVQSCLEYRCAGGQLRGWTLLM